MQQRHRLFPSINLGSISTESDSSANPNRSLFLGLLCHHHTSIRVSSGVDLELVSVVFFNLEFTGRQQNLHEDTTIFFFIINRAFF
jgi:hypothetical protein